MITYPICDVARLCFLPMVTSGPIHPGLLVQNVVTVLAVHQIGLFMSCEI